MAGARALPFCGALVVVASCLGCDVHRLGGPFSATPHERYARALARAGLDRSALGRAWTFAADSALRHPVTVRLPFAESLYYPAAEAWATAYRFPLRQGERLVARAAFAPGDTLGLFLDLFEMAGAGAPRRVASARDSLVIEHEPRAGGTFLLRVQPELLRGARVGVSLRTAPVLAFPVAGSGPRAIGGAFGDPRDRGRRRHHGIDIFAPRGTPALAASDGIVTSAGTNPLGGRVVWLLDPERGLHLYYAHLDRQIARTGQRVRRGDTLGLVGNTGNARGTPPHLHFGIYAGGPLDPTPFVKTASGTPAPVRVSDRALGRFARLTRRATLVLAPGRERTLAAGAILQVVAAAGGRYRVRLAEGGSGYLGPWPLAWLAPRTHERPVRAADRPS